MQRHKTVGISERQWPKQRMIEERKRRSVRSDTERDRDNSCDSEARRLPENAQRPSEILP